MSRKTSVSLSDEDDAALKAEIERGGSLRDVIRRGLGTEPVNVALVREAVAAAHDDMYAAVDELVERKVKAAMREAQGGGGAW